MNRKAGVVAEGFVREGHFRDDESSPLPLSANFRGKGGHQYALSGLLQTVGMVPFFAAGHFIDQNIGSFKSYPFGYVFLWFYNPLMAAIGAAALSALVYMARGSLRVGGGDPVHLREHRLAVFEDRHGATFMATMIVAFAVALYASGSVIASGASDLRLAPP